MRFIIAFALPALALIAAPSCVLDFEDPDPGIVGELTEAVTPTQWWVACAELEAQ